MIGSTWHCDGVVARRRVRVVARMLVRPVAAPATTTTKTTTIGVGIAAVVAVKGDWIRNCCSGTTGYHRAI